MQFYRNTRLSQTFAPELHEFLVEADGLFLYPMKDTDRWSPVNLSSFEEISKDTVPDEVRLKAAQRLGARRRWVRA